MSETSSQSLPALPTIPAGYLCYRCAYPLTGLACDGECPECSTRYSFALAFTGKPHPGEAKLAVRIAFPALVAAGSLAVVLCVGILKWIGGGGRSDLGDFASICTCTSIVAGAVNLFYVPIVTSAMTSEYVPPHMRKSSGRNMRYLGRWVYAGWMLGLAAIAAPVVVIAITALLAILL